MFIFYFLRISIIIILTQFYLLHSYASLNFLHAWLASAGKILASEPEQAAHRIRIKNQIAH